eukprot:1131514-Prorocentrum_lima.AAC.1
MRTDTPTVVVESTPHAPVTPHPPVDPTVIYHQVLEACRGEFQSWLLQAQEMLSRTLALQVNT